MKQPFFIVLALVLGIMLTNFLIPKKPSGLASDTVEDKIETSQAADIPLN